MLGFLFIKSNLVLLILLLTIPANSDALPFASEAAFSTYLLTTSTEPSHLVISIVILVATAAITPNAKTGGRITAITAAAIPALTGTSTSTASSFLILILLTFPFSMIFLSQALNSSTVSPFTSSPVITGFSSLTFSFSANGTTTLFSIYINASNKSPLLIVKASLAIS